MFQVNILLRAGFIGILFIFEFNKDLTVEFAPPFLVMTENFLMQGQKLKVTKFQHLSEISFGMILKKWRGGI